MSLHLPCRTSSALALEFRGSLTYRLAPAVTRIACSLAVWCMEASLGCVLHRCVCCDPAFLPLELPLSYSTCFSPSTIGRRCGGRFWSWRRRRWRGSTRSCGAACWWPMPRQRRLSASCRAKMTAWLTPRATASWSCPAMRRRSSSRPAAPRCHWTATSRTHLPAAEGRWTAAGRISSGIVCRWDPPGRR